MKNARIRIESDEPGIDSGQTEEAQGAYYLRDGREYLIYKVVREEQGKKISLSCRITYDDGVLSVRRDYGDYVTEMKIAENREHEMTYPTAAGSFAIQTRGRRVGRTLTAGGLEYYVEYDLALMGNHMGTRKTRIKVELTD